jgi:hypothetical protein
MKIEKMNPDAAAIWLQMAFFAANPGIEAEDDWGIELPVDGASGETPDDEVLMLRTVSF